ncbi:hypothetical protein, partial [Sutterella sp.]|uniref:hypothetical protein n=1 Tax=Sutterella sp. TaxID=1981025 RepID=UPI0026DECB2E
VNTVEPVENGFHTDTNFFEWLAGTLMGNQNFVAVIADDIKRMTAPAILPRQKFATVGALYDYLHEELSVSICPSLTRKSLIELHVPDRDRGGEHDWSMITFRSGYAADFGLCEDCTSDTGSALGLQALCADPYGEE